MTLVSLRSWSSWIRPIRTYCRRMDNSAIDVALAISYFAICRVSELDPSVDYVDIIMQNVSSVRCDL